MKTKIATALSVVGVLGAGSAAALVNTQILDDGEPESGASAAVLPPASSVDVTIPELTIPDDDDDSMGDDDQSESSVPESSVPASTSSTTEPTSTVPESTVPAPSEFLTAFNVGEAGVVTVDVVDGQLVLVSAEPKDGWEITEAEENDDNEVEVEFRSATVRVEFEAAFVDGQIVPSVESYSLETSPATTVADDDSSDDISDDDDSSDDISDDDMSDDDASDDTPEPADDDDADSSDDDESHSGDDDPSDDEDSSGDDDSESRDDD